MVIVTHDQDEALSMSDRVAVMNAGRIEQYSTPGELYARPRTTFVAQFIGTMNSIEGTLIDGVIQPGTDLVGIRPEDVLFSTERMPGGLPVTVERIVPRGHFHEVLLQRSDALLRAYLTGAVPALGSAGFARIAKALTFRNGVLIESPADNRKDQE
jgi:putative spermidine/putrescine transport system ATP-binding protein